MPQLKRLTVQNCRGIVNGPDLNFGTGGVILCGDNGSGKSSYVDALEKLLTGTCGSIDTHTQGISWAKQGKHIHAKSDPAIELEIEDSATCHTISLSQPTIPYPKKVQNFVDSAAQSSFILRRRTLLDFIDAKPADRWKTIETILNVDRFRNCEQELETLITTHTGNTTATERTIRQKEDEIRSLLDIDREITIDEISCITNLNERLKTLGFKEIVSLENTSNVLPLIENELSAFSNIDRWQKLLQFGNSLKNHLDYEDTITLFQEYGEKTKALAEEEIKLTGHFYEEVLKTGLQWISEDKLENCPLCGGTISFDDVEKYVTEQIKEHSEIIRLKNERDSAHSEVFQKLQSYIRYLDSINENLDNVFKSKNEAQFKAINQKIHELTETHSSPSDVITIETDCVVLQECIASPVISDIQNEVNNECSSSPDIERLRQLNVIKTGIELIPNIISDINSERRKLQSYNRVNTQLTQILLLATQARKNAVQIFMNAISETADEYYQHIHPGESIGSPEISVRDATSASLELKSDFYGIEGDPRGYYSEGHVDSLGLCIFLAIRRFQYQKNEDFAFLVLDDVLHSVDGSHRRQTADMIFEKFSDHQIFITTHDPLWFESLKKASNSHMKGKILQKYRISNWTLEEGPEFGDHLNDFEWLTSKNGLNANPSDKAAKAGKLLEEMLQELCHNLKVSVPFNKEGRYTIDTMWGPFQKKAKKKSGFKDPAKLCLEQIENTRQVRNWVGAHWNEWALQLTATEANEFSDAVIELRKLVYCDKCNRFITEIADLDDVWSCKKQHLKYEKMRD